MMTLNKRLEQAIHDVPDFPKPGILFKDITPVLMDPVLFSDLIKEWRTLLGHLGADKIAAIESRGFLFGVPLAMELGLPFVLIRKEGKLPAQKVTQPYDLEYGQAVLEMHVGDVLPGERMLIVDDLLATGGTALAAAQLIQSQGAVVVGFSFLVSLSFLPGVEKLRDFGADFSAIIKYD